MIFHEVGLFRTYGNSSYRLGLFASGKLQFVLAVSRKHVVFYALYGESEHFTGKIRGSELAYSGHDQIFCGICLRIEEPVAGGGICFFDSGGVNSVFEVVSLVSESGICRGCVIFPFAIYPAAQVSQFAFFGRVEARRTGVHDIFPFVISYASVQEIGIQGSFRATNADSVVFLL
jgi:hypothetical protein